MNPEQELLPSGQGTVPNPDPTARTIQSLQREIAALKELVFTRLDGMDKALVLFQDSINRVPSETEKEIRHLKELIEERFGSIGTRFVERDARSAQTKQDSKVAVDTALESAEKLVTLQQQSSERAIAKSESQMAESIKSLQTLINTAIATLDSKISDVKERLTSIDGRTAGQATAANASQLGFQNVGMIIMALVSIASVAVAVISLTRDPVAPPAAVIVERPVTAAETETTTTRRTETGAIRP